MRTSTVMHTLAVCLLPLVGGAYAHDLAAPTAEIHWMKDSAITVAITARLAAEHFSRITHLRVSTDTGGVVSLSGTTATRSEAARALAIARRTEGVLRVRNGIIVQGQAH